MQESRRFLRRRQPFAGPPSAENIQLKLRILKLPAPPPGTDMDDVMLSIPRHIIVHDTFNTHPSGLTAGQRGMLIRHLNGNRSDNHAMNLAECTVYDALEHIDDWTTDWVCYLNEEEQEFLKENVDTIKELFRPAA